MASQEQMELQTGDNPPKHHKSSRLQQIMKDFRRLPKPVRPTPFYVLEQGRSVLLVHHTAANEDLHVAQRRLIRKLMAFNSRDAEGSIAVVYSRGYGPVLRQVTIWDHLGERTVPMLSADLEQWIADWFRDHA